MRKVIILLMLLKIQDLLAQLTACPNGLMYSQTSPIQAYNPNLPLSSTNPYTIAVTGSSSGLAYGPNLNAASPNPTFYTIISGNYAYWNGSGWTNTGHSTGNTAAVNIGVGPGCLYNLVGGTGQVYVYNGTGPGTLLTTVSGFSGGGPYDIVVDNCCNFYIFKATAPQSLSAYSPTGVLLGSCTVSGMPTTSSGIGFAIVGNKVVVINGSGMFVGTVSGSAVSFTNVTSIPNGGDVASCPIPCGMCYTILPINFKSISCFNSETSNMIEWETALEEAVNNFYIERSTDAQNFEVIGSVVANNYPSKYQFLDNKPSDRQINYYRIRAIEKYKVQGAISDVCYARSAFNSLTASSVYPNPSTGECGLDLFSENDANISINIYNTIGSKLVKEEREIAAGMNRVDLQSENLGNGVYILEVISSNNELIHKQKFTIIK